MENNLPVAAENVSNDDLMDYIGQNTGGNFNSLPRLRINKEALDEDEKAIPPGTLTVYVMDEGTNVYLKNPTFRMFCQRYQFRVYDATAGKYTNKSVQFKDWKDEKPDELGGDACGKIARKDHKGLSEIELAVQKRIKCARVLYGTVSGSGVTNDGKEVTIEALPCAFYAQGLNFQIVGDIIQAYQRRGQPIVFYDWVLSTERRKQGSNTYYVIVVNPSYDVTHGLSDEDKELYSQFDETIATENTSILEKYQEALKSESDVSDESDKQILDELNLNDPLPESMKDVTPK